MRIGFLVNPVAGMGGTVGLKGTDDVEEAARRGGKPRGPERADRFLRALRGDHAFLAAGGSMGVEALRAVGVEPEVVHEPGSPTTRDDTVAAARAFAEAGVDVVVFVGGDGTASDVAEGLDERAPALGVPSGVKMYSPVFAESPEGAAAVVESGWDDTRTLEVLDIDEAAFRKGELRVALKGTLLVPAHRAVQSGKLADADDEVEQETLADAVADLLEPGVTYVLGAGTTMARVKATVAGEGTLLGVDAVRDGEYLARDAAEKDLLALPDPLHVIVSPIGAQGFFLGRGNLQISADVLRRAGVPDGVTVVATPEKLRATAVLRADTGDPALDAEFPPWVRVVTGHGQTTLMRLARERQA